MPKLGSHLDTMCPRSSAERCPGLSWIPTGVFGVVTQRRLLGVVPGYCAITLLLGVWRLARPSRGCGGVEDSVFLLLLVINCQVATAPLRDGVFLSSTGKGGGGRRHRPTMCGAAVSVPFTLFLPNRGGRGRCPLHDVCGGPAPSSRLIEERVTGRVTAEWCSCLGTPFPLSHYCGRQRRWSSASLIEGL